MQVLCIIMFNSIVQESHRYACSILLASIANSILNIIATLQNLMVRCLALVYCSFIFIERTDALKNFIGAHSLES